MIISPWNFLDNHDYDSYDNEFIKFLKLESNPLQPYNGCPIDQIAFNIISPTPAYIYAVAWYNNPTVFDVSTSSQRVDFQLRVNNGDLHAFIQSGIVIKVNGVNASAISIVSAGRLMSFRYTFPAQN